MGGEQRASGVHAGAMHYLRYTVWYSPFQFPELSSTLYRVAETQPDTLRRYRVFFTRDRMGRVAPLLDIFSVGNVSRFARCISVRFFSADRDDTLDIITDQFGVCVKKKK